VGRLVGVGERWRVAELVDRYVGAARYWSPATMARREIAARMVAGDRLGTVRVGRLSPRVLGAAMDRWRAAGVSAATVRAAHGVVRFAVSWAVEQRWLAADVLAAVGGVPGCSPRGQAPVSTVRAVVAAAREDVRRAEERHVRCGGSSAVELGLFRAEQRLLLVYLVADTGLRCGELAGLRSDDLLGRELWIERAVKRDLRGGAVVGPTKSHRHDRLTVSAATAHCWHEHVHTWHSPSPRPCATKRVAVQGQSTGRAAHFNRRAGSPV
jgi:integrase